MTVTPPPPIPLSPLHPPPPNPSDPQPTKTAKTCKLEQGELAHDQSSFPFSHTKKIFVTQPHNSHFIELLTQIFTTASCPYKMQKNLKPIREIVPAFFGNRGETSSQLSFTQQYLKTVEFVQVEHLSSKQTTTNASYYTYYCLNINRQHHDHLHLDLLTISNNNIFIVTVTVIIAQPFDTDSCQVYYRGQCCQHLHISEHFARSQLHCYGNDDWGMMMLMVMVMMIGDILFQFADSASLHLLGQLVLPNLMSACGSARKRNNVENNQERTNM